MVRKYLSALSSESWFNFYLRHFKKIVVVVTVLLLGIILLLGWASAKKVREVVTNDFNQQQLLLARHAAGQIENRLNILKRELSLLSLSPSIQYSEAVSLGNRLGIAFSSIQEIGGLEIRFVENKTLKTHIVNDRGYSSARMHPDDIEFLEWAKLIENKERIFLTEVLPMGQDGSADKLVMRMVLPVWQVSVDEAHPVATNQFSGVLVFVVDVSSLVKGVTKDIKSGKSGYAWVIDNNGTFLYHPEVDFVGKNAFEVRKVKNPAISFSRINEIQRELMLAGKEGTSWYISGWHRGREGKIKKLIAFAPVNLTDTAGNLIWSVAVVAPISEVEDAIHTIQIRQYILEGFVVLIILAGSILIMGIMFRWSSSLKDEVERKTKELKKSEDQYKSLIENANDIIFTVKPNGEILSLNQAGRSFFKKVKGDVEVHNIREICFNEESTALQLKSIESVFHSGQSRQITYPININGEEHWLSTNFTLLRDEDAKPSAVLGISRDITDIKKKEKEDQMYHAEKLASMGTLAAGVAHEINNPIAIILGFTDLLLEKTKADSQEYDVLKTIEKQAANAKRVVENLLSFSRYSEYHAEAVDINENIETVLAIVKNTLLLNNISLTQQFHPDLPKVKADPGELQQVFLNIINNAIHAMKGGGILTITTALLNDNQVEIRFADTGHGIKKEHRAKIFDPLFTTKKVGEGTGLGLSVSYGIITKYGGMITFETKTEEESSEHGTTFIITLPAIKTVNRE